MANTRISDLTASASNLAASDLVPVVQTPGVGPVKMTGTQIKTGIIGAGSVSIASGKTFTSSNTLTLAGTDSTTMTFPSTSATLARTDAGNTFTGAQTFSVGTVNGTGLDISQTWTGTGTYTGLKYNVGTDSGPSNAASLLLDLQVGGASKFKVDKAGNVTAASDTVSVINATSQISLNNTSIGFTNNAATLANNIPLGWSSSGVWYGTVDTILTRAAAATLQLGAADAAAPVAQTFKVQSGTAGASATTVSISGTSLTIAGTVTGTIAIGHAVTGTGVSAGTLITAGSGTSWTVNNSQTVGPITAYFNSVGADFTIRGSQGSGPSAGGSLIFQVAPAGSAATTAQNAYSTALTIDSTRKATFAAGIAATSLDLTANAYVTIPSGYVNINVNGNWGVTYQSDELRFANSGGILGWSSGSNAASDVKLQRDAANTLALRNGGTSGTPVPQTFRVYNWGDATNGEFGAITWTSNVLEFGAAKNGTGTNRMVRFTSPATSGTAWDFRSTGQATPNFVLAGSDRSVTLYPQTNMLTASSGGFWSALNYSAGGSAVHSFRATDGANSTQFALDGVDTGIMQVNNGNGKGTGYGASVELWEMTAPAATATNGVRIYAEDNGSGKTRLMALFATGAAQQIAIEP